jgi:hypothetical protein
MFHLNMSSEYQNKIGTLGGTKAFNYGSNESMNHSKPEISHARQPAYPSLDDLVKDYGSSQEVTSKCHLPLPK